MIDNGSMITVRVPRNLISMYIDRAIEPRAESVSDKVRVI